MNKGWTIGWLKGQIVFCLVLFGTVVRAKGKDNTAIPHTVFDRIRLT